MQFRMLFDQSPVVNLIVDPATGCVTEANEAAVRFYGYPRAELVGLPIWRINVLPAEDIRACMGEVLSAKPSVFLFQHRLASGEVRDVRVHSGRLQVDGRPLLFSIIQDISDELRAQRQTELNAERLRSLVHLNQMQDEARLEDLVQFALEEAVRLTGSKAGYLHFMNADGVSLRLFRWSEGVIRHCAAQGVDMYPLEEAGIWADCARTLSPCIHNDYATAAGRRGLPEGHIPITRHMSVPVLENGRVVAIAGVGNKPEPYGEDDVNQLLLFMDGLWTIIRQRRSRDELLAATARAEAASRAKSEFLANMSHEIRTPLNGLLGMLQLLKITPLTAAQQGYVDLGLRSGRNLTELLSDILDLSRIEAGKLTLVPEEFSLPQILEAVGETFQLAVSDKGLDLSASMAPDVPRRLLGDAGRLKQILFNLVGNAVKFTLQGRVALFVDCPQPAPDNGEAGLLFTVSDTGVGMPEDLKEHLFEPFTRAEGCYERRFPGAGLGLSIVKRLARLMGGDVEVDSELGRGTTVRLRCRFRVLDGQPACLDAAVPDWTHIRLRARVLLAEDDKVNRLVSRAYLERMGCEVTCVTNGREALAALRQEDFDCVLMDVQMPELDGVAATRRIRDPLDACHRPDLPILGLTAYAIEEDRQAFLAAGMNEALSKPLRPEDLARALRRYIRDAG